MNPLTVKRHNSFQSENNGKAAHNFALRSLIFKLQQEVLEFKDICMKWSCENRTVESVLIVTFK